MRISDIAFKNLLRRKTKAAFILAGLVIGVATVVAVITFTETMTQDINHKLEKYGANILVVPHTDALTLSYGGVSMGGVSFEMKPIRESDLHRIHTIQYAANIAAVGPMVLGAVRVADQPVMLAGVDFTASAILKPWWKIDGRPPGVKDLIVGADAARIMNLNAGDAIDIQGQALQVSGILEPTGSQDDQLMFTHLKTAQTILGKPGEVSMVEVAALCMACPVEEMVAQIAAKLPDAKVMAIQQVVKGRMETLSHFRDFSFGLSVVVILIGGLVVLVTLMGSVKERTREIGIFRAIGFRQRNILQIILLETAFISLLAGMIGYFLGVGSIWIGLQFFSSGEMMHLAIDPLLAAGAVSMALLVGLSAGAYPAAMAAGLDPNQALSSL